MPDNPKKTIPYTETICCSASAILTFSLLLTLVVDFLIIIMIGPSRISMDGFQWMIVLSIAIFMISLFYTMLRYRIKLSVSKGILDKRLFLSISGVGKGARHRFPVDAIVSCTQGHYASPMKGFYSLLFTSNAPVTQSTDSSVFTVSLPGYTGSGITIKYTDEFGLKEKTRGLCFPTNHPDVLCDLLKTF